ncbi:MAG: SRPBCC domain-containing protein [Polyangiaceae bacterium]
MNERAHPGDRVRVSVRVDVERAEAFRIFTEEIDRWWRHGMAYRVAGKRRGIIALEPRLGGRLYESFETKSGPKIIETGKVLVWQPPERLRLEWRNVNFAADEVTHVDVAFELSGGSTLVTVTHSGWSSLRPDHPARHGRDIGPFIAATGRWWGELLRSFQLLAEA